MSKPVPRQPGLPLDIPFRHCPEFFDLTTTVTLNPAGRDSERDPTKDVPESTAGT